MSSDENKKAFLAVKELIDRKCQKTLEQMFYEVYFSDHGNSNTGLNKMLTEIEKKEEVKNVKPIKR